MIHAVEKLRVAILGSGNIGTDLLMKVRRSPDLTCSMFVGRNLDSAGLSKASELGVAISDRSLDAIVAHADSIDLVFDATSARDHAHNAAVLASLHIPVIDLTPALLGPMCVPAVNLDEVIECPNVNMVTCGGQASVPLAYAISKAEDRIDYIEVVSTIASRSAGPATRLNIDEYIETTECAIRHFTGVKSSKAILNLNPATPCIDMQTTVFAAIESPDMDRLCAAINSMITRIQSYVPGYRLLVPPSYEQGRLTVMVKTQGLGDFLPSYAGNLDIINCAAIATAEAMCKRRRRLRSA